MKKSIQKAIEGVRKSKPMIHCITNPISINLCANGILAVGGRPIMAEHPSEAEEITSASDSLLLNLGNITDVRIKSMKISSCTAARKSTPIVLDAVGVGCSALRRNFANELISEKTISIIKGNYSEIIALTDENSGTRGVDAESADKQYASECAVRLSEKADAVVIASGKTDIIAEKSKLFFVKNGTTKLSQITGSGCLLGALAACCSACVSLPDAAVCACAVLGICGELAATADGSGSFQTNLLDALSTFDGTLAEKHLRMEEEYYA